MLEVHNGITGLIVEQCRVEKEGVAKEFDAMWSSSLTDSTARGKPDIEAVDLSARLISINDIFEVTTKPLIFDGDTGGRLEHFPFMVRSLERMGVSAVIIEDKIGLKRNSLFGADAGQQQDTIEAFCAKLQAGKKARITEEFMLIARIESLILKQGMADALLRARHYVKDGGADAIMIHSKEQSSDEIVEFCRAFRAEDENTPLVAVPSSYNSMTEDVLIAEGVNMVIYANHLLRAAIPSMKKVAESILENGRSLEADEFCMPIGEILTLIPEEV